MLTRCAKRFVNVIKTKGIIEALTRVIRRVAAVLLALIIILIWPFKKIRLIRLISSRIGHYAQNTHMLLCALKYNTFPEEKNCVHFYYIQTHVPVCNVFLHKMWSRVIRILPSWGAFWGHVDYLLRITLRKRYQTPFKKRFEDFVGALDMFGYCRKDRNQFLSFSKEEETMGEELKIKLGIPADKLFVCLLVRDTAYTKTIFPDSVWDNENFRHADIKSYIPAIEFLIQNGFYVVRMGKLVENALDIGDARLIDYANHPVKSDFMDIYLSAHCFFFISTPCGLDDVPRIFNRPTVATNAILFQEKCYTPWTFLIPKNIMSMKTQVLVSYQEQYQDYKHFILSGKYTNLRDPIMEAWKRKGWFFIDNTPDELLAVVKEALDYMTHSVTETFEIKDLQLQFWKSYPTELPSAEASYENVIMRISPYFLKKHYNLLNQSMDEIYCEAEITQNV